MHVGGNSPPHWHPAGLFAAIQGISGESEKISKTGRKLQPKPHTRFGYLEVSVQPFSDRVNITSVGEVRSGKFFWRSKCARNTILFNLCSGPRSSDDSGIEHCLAGS